MGENCEVFTRQRKLISYVLRKGIKIEELIILFDVEGLMFKEEKYVTWREEIPAYF